MLITDGPFFQVFITCLLEIIPIILILIIIIIIIIIIILVRKNRLVNDKIKEIDSEIESIYKLQNYSNVDEVTKEKHIKYINSNC